jgi:uncharacterized protein (UPF0333 family)
VKRFFEEKEKMDERQVPFRKNYDENDNCTFENLQDIGKKSNLWPMIKNHVLSNPEFHQALTTTHKTPFNLRG